MENITYADIVGLASDRRDAVTRTSVTPGLGFESYRIPLTGRGGQTSGSLSMDAQIIFSIGMEGFDEISRWVQGSEMLTGTVCSRICRRWVVGTNSTRISDDKFDPPR